MKKIVYLFLVISFLGGFSNVYAGNDEERKCFNLLQSAVKNDSRFQDPEIFKDNKGLKKVLFNESTNQETDLSTYGKFQSKRVINPLRKYQPGYKKYIFQARRNNIGTVINNNNYVLSQITGFGKDSNFDFPLEAKTGIPFGDKYSLNEGGFFKEYLLYTHHLKGSGDFLSCGIVRIMPLDQNNFSSLDESRYLTNVLLGAKKQSKLNNKKCSSGFEGEYKTVGHSNSQKYYAMKANICVLDQEQKDFLRMEVISIAYDNKSKKFNEYITHPLQVTAMKNNSNHANGLKGIQIKFLEALQGTCLTIVHGHSLPGHCNTSSFNFNINSLFSLSNFMPQAFSSLDVDGEDAVEEENTGMLFRNIPYTLYQKLSSIPDETFRSYIELAILPSYEDILSQKQKKEVLLTPFEETFLQCGIEYQERLDIVISFLETLDIDTFNLEELTYVNKKFGDCIVPYPDAENIDSVIDGSFVSNQLLAKKLLGLHTPESVPQHVLDYSQKRADILKGHNMALEDLEKRYNEGSITRVDFIEEQEIKKAAYESQRIALESELDKSLQKNIVTDPIEDTQKIPIENKNIPYKIILICFLLLAGIGIIIYVLRKKSKV